MSTSGWEGICLAWSFRELGLDLTSCRQITGLRLSKGCGAPTSQGLLGKGDRSPLRLLTATNLCFAERNVYTSEVLAVVMQQLMDQSPLPMLLMRTVIQSLTMYPRLGGFVMNILSRLIMKQVTRPDHPGLPGRGLPQDVLPTDLRKNCRLFQPVWPVSQGSPRAETCSMTGRLLRQYSPLGLTVSDSSRAAGWRVRLLGGRSRLREVHVQEVWLPRQSVRHLVVCSSLQLRRL